MKGSRGRLGQAVGQLGAGLKTAERPWGSWRVLAAGVGYKIKLITVLPGHRLSLQFHHQRSEHWVVASGRARVIVGDIVSELASLESITVPMGAVHRLENPGAEPLVVLELQTGETLSEEDIVRVEDDYDRV
ncbi:MAG: phosphomannose isomerase type II C-terminal cupin domain [candidate division NC10 bacterium]|nr:phosphomannose isomerase type II C-terminal cupin domain [candidate division NC10 bacterium]